MSLEHSRRNAQPGIGKKTLFSSIFIALLLLSVFIVIYTPEFIAHGITWAHGDDFETGAPASFWIRSQYDPYIVTTSPDSVKSGNYGANSTNGSQFYVWYYDLGGGTGTTWFSIDFKILGDLNYFGSGGWIFYIRCNDTVHDYGAYLNLVMETGYAYFQWIAYGDTAEWMDGSHITNNTWYFLKIKNVVTASAMYSTLYIDNVEDCNVTTTRAGLQYSTVSLTSAPGWYFNMAVDNYGQSGEEPSSSYGSPSMMDLTVNSYPSGLPVSFTYNGTFYGAPQTLTPGEGDIITLVALNSSYVSCKWLFSYWLLNMTDKIYSDTYTFNITGTTIMTMYYVLYDPTLPENSTTLNLDGDVANGLDHDTYWNPHCMAGNQSDPGGDLILADLDTWSIDFSQGYVNMTLDSNSTDRGHIAAGSWYYAWNTSDGLQARQPLADGSYILSFDLNIVNVTYGPTSWLRIAVAVAWCDPTNASGYEVKYVERDLYDNPVALNHSYGNAAGNGNVIYKGGDVLEYRYDDMPMGEWRHYDWNISQYLEAAFGDLTADARLESFYVVIEVENVTHSEVHADNMWLRVLNSTAASQYNAWDSRVTRTEGSSNIDVRWVTAMRNGTDGYGVYSQVRTDEWIDTGTHLLFADDHQDAYWNVITNGTSSLSAEVDSSFKMNGTDSLKVNGSRGSATDECYIKYPFLSASPLRIWTDYDFFIFFMYFNESDLYFHRFQAIDNNSETIEWPILDYFNNVTSSTWSMITLPIRRPTLGNCSTFNYANVTELRFWPDRSYCNFSEAYGKDFTIWMDQEYLDKASSGYVTFNAPLSADTNVTIYGKKEIAGWDSQYLPIISSTYASNGTNYQLLRPEWFPNWAPQDPYSATSAALGYTEYARTYSGGTATAIGGESTSAVLVNGTSMGEYKKLILRLKLAPFRANYSTDNNDGDYNQPYTFGDLSELDFMVYYQTDMFIDLISYKVNLEGCGNWLFVNEKYYDFNLTIGTMPGTGTLDTVSLNFTMLTRNGYVNNVFSCQSGNWSVSFNPSNTSLNPTRAAAGIISTDGFVTSYDFKIYFTEDSMDIWKDDCVDVGGWMNNTLGSSSAWILIESNYFKVYAQGGFVINSTVTGNAGVLDTATPFSFYAENNSYVYRAFIYRDLVHIKMLPQMSAIVGKQTFYISFGMDYCLNGYDWVEGWKVILGAESVTTGSVLYFNWSVSWWNRGAFVKQEYIRAFHHTNVPRGWYDPAVNYTTTTALWIDLWFDRQNASAVAGGRVNAYEFAMTDSVEPWLALLTSNWGPIENATKSSMQMFPILDGDDVTVIPASQIKMVKVWSSLEVAAYSQEQTVVISDFPVWDLTFSQPFPPLTGIQTPIFDETTYPSMPGGGIMGALFSSLSGLFSWMGENILYGGLRIWPALVGFLDTIAAWLGFPGGFSSIMTWLGGGWAWLVESFSYIGLMLVQFFIFLGSIMGYVVSLLTTAITQFVAIITIMAGFFQGGYGTGVDIWNAYGLTTWLTLACICYPIYLVILWDEEGFDALTNHLMFVFNILNLLAHFFISVIQMVFNGIHTLIEAIPVVE